MAKLTKSQRKDHQAAMALLEKDVLTREEKEFVFSNFHEGANHMNGNAGAFFTSFDLACELAVECNYSHRAGTIRVIDLCAGIGMLAYGATRWMESVELVCVEANPDYVAVGKKLLPDATWICASLESWEELRELGRFDVALSNPPWGRAVPTMRDVQSPRYTGAVAEYKVLDIAEQLAEACVFLMPQNSAGFKYSGVQCYTEYLTDEAKKFMDQTGIVLAAGCGIDTTVMGQAFKDVEITCEVVCPDFDAAKPVIIQTAEQFGLAI